MKCEKKQLILTIFTSLKGERMKSIPLLFVVLLVALALGGKGKHNNYLYVCIYFFFSGTPTTCTNRSLILTLRGNFESINSHQWISAFRKPYFMMHLLVYISSYLKSFWSKQTADISTKFPQELPNRDLSYPHKLSWAVSWLFALVINDFLPSIE